MCAGVEVFQANIPIKPFKAEGNGEHYFFSTSHDRNEANDRIQRVLSKLVEHTSTKGVFLLEIDHDQHYALPFAPVVFVSKRLFGSAFPQEISDPAVHIVKASEKPKVTISYEPLAIR